MMTRYKITPEYNEFIHQDNIHEMYDGEWVRFDDINIQELLKKYITFVYHHESEFLEEFFPELDDDIWEVTECYMASERIRLLLSSYDKPKTTTIPTDDLINWVDNYV